ncbi:hypothetical protein [Henriciella aquimarina]|uniref:hypothetical protein n=1 Tax=Henriciella aquimarina TaxID=545261 RepID=UPI0009FF8D4B|nr:hypothetical protein [Henriciella aquimarina]
MRLRKDYSPERVITPVTQAVHWPVGGGLWINARAYDPPMPKREGERGWPVWILEHQGRELRFASPEEMAHVAHVLGHRVMPRPWQMTGTDYGYHNQHWLSRLDKAWTPWPVRQALVDCLRAASG